MTRINLFTPFRSTAARNVPARAESVAWGKINLGKINFEKTGGAVMFAAILIVCSLAVGCSSDSPKSVSANQSASQNVPAPQMLASNTSARPVDAHPKPAPKKVVRKRPATITYVDKTYGVSFEYPRRYAIETGEAATNLVDSNPLPMNFVQPGGTALVAVELPLTGFANTDFSSAYFNVSVNKAIAVENCGKFSAPQTTTPDAPAVTSNSAPATPADSGTVAPTQTASEPPRPQATSTEQAKADAEKPTETAGPADAKPAAPAESSNATPQNPTALESPAPKVMLSDMEAQKTEAVSGQGNQQSDSKYVHVYKNGACYEFAINVNTIASQNDGSMKHVDRDKVFARLEKILATVKINPVEAQKEAEKEAANTPANATTSAATPAQ